MTKTENQQLFFQFLMLLPLVLFLAIYPQEGYRVLVAFVPLILWGYNLYRRCHDQRIIRYPLLGILVVSFFIYAFYSLGSRSAPQEFVDLDTRHPELIFTLKQPATIDEFAYYVGIDNNSKFKLEYWENKEWKKLYQYDKNFPFSFRWNRVKLSPIAFASPQEVSCSERCVFCTKITPSKCRPLTLGSMMNPR